MKLRFVFSLLALTMPALSQAPSDDTRSREIREIRQQMLALTARLDALEKSDATNGTASPPTKATDPMPMNAPGQQSASKEKITEVVKADGATLRFFRGTTLNFGFDGYYGYNFNQPVGRVNRLHVYDVSSNSFSINQASIMVEHLPTAEERFGGRIDLQFGQATETLQGSSANELRPQVYRNLFQAYGSYLAPVGSGLQIDFGKFASSLGAEGNYTKDQIAYSRSYSFGFLPYYHMGMRANYNLTPKVNVAYWLVNGANQTEDFNGFKSQGFIFTLKPAAAVTWNVNYYFGEEGRDVVAVSDTGSVSGAGQTGQPSANISPAPNGREHIFDTYATWTPTPKLTLVGEADYVLNRTLSEQQPGRVAIAAFYTKYALSHSSNIAGRFEYLDDRGGLYSGSTQALKEVSLIADHTFGAGFLARGEYRRDFSNQPFFLSDTAGVLRHTQSTATLGLVYWWGTKQGAW